MYCSRFLFILIVGWLFSCEKEVPKKTPNILMIAIDDLNTWLGCMDGHPHVITPNIDRLASLGTLFTRAYCQAPLCGPSRASIMSGLRPSSTGIYGQINDDKLRSAHPLLDSLSFLPQHFEAHGYLTMGVGKLFHQHAPDKVFEVSGGREKGFGPKPPNRLKWDRQGTSTDWGAFPATDEEMPDFRTAQWAIDKLGNSYDQPFLLTLGFLRPHVPWHVPQKWFDMYPLDQVQTPPYRKNDREDVPLISNEVAEVAMMPTTEWAIQQGEWKAIVQAYLASISFVDHYVGEVLNALENSEHVDNTIVVLWSDHGYHLGEKNRFAKHSLWNEATHVPLILAGPGIPGGQKIDLSVELLDVYPSLSELCGIPIHPSNEGMSFKGLLEGKTSYWNKSAITTYGKNNHAISKGKYRYIRYEDGSEELYDRHIDPNEWTNLIGQQAVPHDLIEALPTHNESWSIASHYDGYPYFKAQRAKDLSK